MIKPLRICGELHARLYIEVCEAYFRILDREDKIPKFYLSLERSNILKLPYLVACASVPPTVGCELQGDDNTFARWSFDHPFIRDGEGSIPRM